MLVFIAAVLRFAFPDRFSVEHWDEAVYSSNLLTESGYPFRFLYAPPLWPAVIEWSMVAFGPTAFAAIFPDLILGTLMIPLCWWVAREWFGPSAGVAAAALAAMSDFHIVYTRTALTDVPLCFWFLLAVYFSWRALTRNRPVEAVVAGVAVAAAWSTKYTGWLPLAVAVSGGVAWALFERFRGKQWIESLSTLAIVAVFTVICFSPVWYGLQSDGGYAAVSSNHATYVVGWKGWPDSFVQQAGNLRYFDRWASASSIAAAFIAASLLAWRTRMAVFASLFGAAATIAGATAVLVLPALLGPLFAVLGLPRSSKNDSRAQARRLASWLLAAWLIGLFVSIPAYWPFPRLLLPWLVAVWLGAAAFIGLVAEWPRKNAAAESVPGSQYVTWGVRGWLAVSLAFVILALVRGSNHSDLAVPGWQDRNARASAILEAAERAKSLSGPSNAARPVIFTYGEPALFFQLGTHGYGPLVVGDMNFLASIRPEQPTFLLAPDTPFFQKGLAPYASRLELVGTFQYTPSDLVLLDIKRRFDLSAGGRPHEDLLLYRVKGS